MDKWFMAVVVGPDRPGIVAKVTSALFNGGCNLGEASMTRLGGNFTMMLMVQHDGREKGLRDLLAPVVASLALHLHIDSIKAELHHHIEPDVRITLFGEDRSGIVAHATATLAEAGLHILSLESDVAGSKNRPIYVLHIEGAALEGVPSLESALSIIASEGIETQLTPVDTVMG